jgi:hypothetical protein
VIDEIYNTQYGNMYIKDAEGNRLCIYGLYSADGKTRFDAMTTQPAVGDTITVIGILGQYNDTPQMKSAWIYDPNAATEEPAAPALPTELTSITVANTIASAKEHNTYTEDKYLVEGVITEIKSNVYGNVYIEDELGNKLYIYGLWNVDGTVRFDKLNPMPKVGDTITVAGILGQYNDAAQMKNGWIVKLVAGEGTEGGETPAEPETPDAPVVGEDGVVSIPDANKICAAQEHNIFTTEKYTVTGKVTEIANTTYGNVYITDAKGNSLYLYGLYSADGSDRFDAMDPQPQVGDIITVVGSLGRYYDTYELKNGYVTSIVAGVVSDEEVVSPLDRIDIPGFNEWYDSIFNKDTSLSVTEALALADGEQVVVKGVVTSVGNKGAWDSKYNNMSVVISDGSKTLEVYRLKTHVNVGDEIIVTGTMSSYNSIRQIAQGATAEIVKSNAQEVTIAEALALADDTYVAITAIIKSIDTAWSSSYKNITVTLDDGTGTLQSYRLASAANLTVGSEITVYGVLDTYKGTRQIAAGASIY